MQLISGFIKGLMQLGWFFVIEILNDIIISFAGIDILSLLATEIYKKISDDEADAAIDAAQKDFKVEFDKYTEAQHIAKGNVQYDEEGNIMRDESGNLILKEGAEAESFDSYNDRQNKTVLGTLRDKITGGATFKTYLFGNKEEGADQKYQELLEQERMLKEAAEKNQIDPTSEGYIATMESIEMAKKQYSPTGVLTGVVNKIKEWGTSISEGFTKIFDKVKDVFSFGVANSKDLYSDAVKNGEGPFSKEYWDPSSVIGDDAESSGLKKVLFYVQRVLGAPHAAILSLGNKVFNGIKVGIDKIAKPMLNFSKEGFTDIIKNGTSVFSKEYWTPPESESEDGTSSLGNILFYAQRVLTFVPAAVTSLGKKVFEGVKVVIDKVAKPLLAFSKDSVTDILKDGNDVFTKDYWTPPESESEDGTSAFGNILFYAQRVLTLGPATIMSLGGRVYKGIKTIIDKVAKPIINFSIGNVKDMATDIFKDGNDVFTKNYWTPPTSGEDDEELGAFGKILFYGQRVLTLGPATILSLGGRVYKGIKNIIDKVAKPILNFTIGNVKDMATDIFKDGNDVFTKNYWTAPTSGENDDELGAIGKILFYSQRVLTLGPATILSLGGRVYKGIKNIIENVAKPIINFTIGNVKDMATDIFKDGNDVFTKNYWTPPTSGEDDEELGAIGKILFYSQRVLTLGPATILSLGGRVYKGVKNIIDKVAKPILNFTIGNVKDMATDIFKDGNDVFTKAYWTPDSSGEDNDELGAIGKILFYTQRVLTLGPATVLSLGGRVYKGIKNIIENVAKPIIGFSIGNFKDMVSDIRGGNDIFTKAYWTPDSSGEDDELGAIGKILFYSQRVLTAPSAATVSIGFRAVGVVKDAIEKIKEIIGTAKEMGGDLKDVAIDLFSSKTPEELEAKMNMEAPDSLTGKIGQAMLHVVGGVAKPVVTVKYGINNAIESVKKFIGTAREMGGDLKDVAIDLFSSKSPEELERKLLLKAPDSLTGKAGQIMLHVVGGVAKPVVTVKYGITSAIDKVKTFIGTAKEMGGDLKVVAADLFSSQSPEELEAKMNMEAPDSLTGKAGQIMIQIVGGVAKPVVTVKHGINNAIESVKKFIGTAKEMGADLKTVAADLFSANTPDELEAKMNMEAPDSLTGKAGQIMLNIVGGVAKPVVLLKYGFNSIKDKVTSMFGDFKSDVSKYADVDTLDGNYWKYPGTDGSNNPMSTMDKVLFKVVRAFMWPVVAIKTIGKKIGDKINDVVGWFKSFLNDEMDSINNVNWDSDNTGGMGGGPGTPPLKKGYQLFNDYGKETAGFERYPIYPLGYIGGKGYDLFNKFGVQTAGYPNYSSGSYHGGVDRDAGVNTPIPAFSEGTVETVVNKYSPNTGTTSNGSSWQGGWGNYVKVRDPYGKALLYAHLNGTTLKAGDKVNVGNTIGIQGHTGYSTGSHLHLEVWKDANNRNKPTGLIDPYSYLKDRTETTLDGTTSSDTTMAGSSTTSSTATTEDTSMFAAINNIRNVLSNAVSSIFGTNNQSTTSDSVDSSDSSAVYSSSTAASNIKGTTYSEKTWNYLTEKGLPAFGVAGLMGNLYAESAIRPNNLQNSYETSLGMSDTQYTNAVNSGSYTRFNTDEAGYGLAQWTSSDRKRGLYNLKKKQGKSIDDIGLQLDWLWHELNNGYKSVLNTLKKASSVREASDKVLTKFEIPADMSEKVKRTRASYGQSYYNQYAGKGGIGGDGPIVIEDGFGGKGYDLFNGFGSQTSGFIRNDGVTFHGGIDRSKGNNTTVPAFTEGTVEKVVNKYKPNTGSTSNGSSWQGGWGNYITVVTPDGRKVLYAHLNGAIAQPGDKINIGDPIGIQGHTGHSSGSHLHFEVWKDPNNRNKGTNTSNTGLLNPYNYLKSRKETTLSGTTVRDKVILGGGGGSGSVSVDIPSSSSATASTTTTEDNSMFSAINKIRTVITDAIGRIFGTGSTSTSTSSDSSVSGYSSSITAASDIKGSTNAEKVWNFLRSKGVTAAGAAGAMGNLQTESGLQPTNLEDTFNKKFGLSDEEYTRRVDNGSWSAEKFANDKSGYGLAQWTWPTRKEGLYKMKQAKNTSIGDLGTQLEWLWEELNTNSAFKPVVQKITSTNSVRDASDTFLLKFEMPLDKSIAMKETRASRAQAFYDLYAGKGGDSGIGGDGDFEYKSSDKFSSLGSGMNIINTISGLQQEISSKTSDTTVTLPDKLYRYLAKFEEYFKNIQSNTKETSENVKNIEISVPESMPQNPNNPSNNPINPMYDIASQQRDAKRNQSYKNAKLIASGIH